MTANAFSTALPNGTPAVGAGDDAVLRAKTEQAAVKFEGLFIGEMLKQMRRSAAVFADEGGAQSKTHGSLLEFADTLVADSIAGQRAFGIADAILRQLLPAEAPQGALKSAAAPVALPLQALPAADAAPASKDSPTP